MVSQMEDFTLSPAFRGAGPTALAEAGITHYDVNHLMIYDAPCSQPGASFAHLPIYGLEDLAPGTTRKSRPPGDARRGRSLQCRAQHRPGRQIAFENQ
jgi:hypothetical protein